MADQNGLQRLGLAFGSITLLVTMIAIMTVTLASPP